MEINNKNIRGIFLYDPTVEFNVGDFVIKGSSIYLVKVDVIGIDPTTKEGSLYYETYLANEIATDDDFEQYAKGLGNDKFVTARTLSRILNKYMSGFSEKGLIGNRIDESGDVYLSDYFGNQSLTNITNSYTNPLDKLMVSSINNGIFVVDSINVRDIFGDLLNPVILRQYTYESGGGLYTRIQELVDVFGGGFRYRYATSDNSYDPKVPWVAATTDNNLLNNINGILKYYQSEINNLKLIKTSLVNNFRFKKADLITVTEGQVWKISRNSNGPYTICTKELESDGIYRTHSATVDLSKVNDSQEIKVYVVNNKELAISSEESFIKFKYSGSTGNEFSIDCIYYQQTYEDVLSSSGSEYEIWKNVKESSINAPSDLSYNTPGTLVFKPEDLGLKDKTFNSMNLKGDFRFNVVINIRREGDYGADNIIIPFYTSLEVINDFSSVFIDSFVNDNRIWANLSISEDKSSLYLEIPIINPNTGEELPKASSNGFQVRYFIRSIKYKS